MNIGFHRNSHRQWSIEHHVVQSGTSLTIHTWHFGKLSNKKQQTRMLIASSMTLSSYHIWDFDAPDTNYLKEAFIADLYRPWDKVFIHTGSTRLKNMTIQIWCWVRHDKEDDKEYDARSHMTPNELQIDWHSGQETIFGVFKFDFDSYEGYLDFETMVLHRISSRIYLAEWFGLRSHFGKNADLAFISTISISFKCVCLQKQTWNYKKEEH